MTIQPELSASATSQAVPTVLRADDIHVRWVMPEIFHDLPIHERDDDEAVRLLEELVDKALQGAEYQDKTAFGVMCALGLGDLVAAGVEYAGVCVTAVGDTPCSATVSVTLVDSPDVEGVAGATREIASSLRRIEAGEVSEIELPCGLAVSCIGTRQEKLPGELTESDESLTFSTAYIRVYVSLPNGTTVVVEMATPNTAAWDLFSTMFGNTVSSIRLFNADGSPLITSGTTGT
ncbi:hypothetical protein [Streptomyces sp. NBC_00827]|uniref:hypothetical protein n=1 Tax=Streptomyces sp. NBC_00827 TaxID=2903677 RepID=UPI00386D4A25|nr:hypothetical protein OG569_14645 [Streptomyces sp. NBC_00827]